MTNIAKPHTAYKNADQSLNSRFADTMASLHCQSFLLLLLSIIAVFLSLSTQTAGEDQGRIIADFFEKPNCKGNWQDVREKQFDRGKTSDGCYLPNGDGSWQSVFFYNFGGNVYTGGGCATKSSQPKYSGCNGFDHDKFITGIGPR